MTSEHLHTGWRACHTKKMFNREWNLVKLNPIEQTPQYNIHGIVVVKCMEQTHKLKMYPSSLLDWVLDFLSPLFFFPGCLCHFKGLFIPVWREIHRSKILPVTSWQLTNRTVSDISRLSRHSICQSYDDSNPFRRNKSTSRLRRLLGRCATSCNEARFAHF